MLNEMNNQDQTFLFLCIYSILISPINDYTLTQSAIFSHTISAFFGVSLFFLKICTFLVKASKPNVEKCDDQGYFPLVPMVNHVFGVSMTRPFRCALCTYVTLTQSSFNQLWTCVLKSQTLSFPVGWSSEFWKPSFWNGPLLCLGHLLTQEV